MPSPIKRMIRTVSKLASATFLSRILGLGRELVMAYYFGASKYTDAFLVAYRIPNLFRDLLAEGAFSQAFVPVLVNRMQKDKITARILLWQTFKCLTIITALICGLMFCFAPFIVRIFAKRFEEDQNLLQTCITLTRLMLPYLVTVSLAAALMAALNALKHFFLPAISTLFFNLAMILSTVIGYPILVKQGINPIYCLGFGVLIGGIAQFLMQLVLIIKAGYGPVKSRLEKTSDLKQIGTNLSVGFFGFAAVQVNLLVNTILATSAGLGVVSWLTYGFRLFQFPVGVFAVSLSNSHLVYFSEAWKKEERSKALEYLKMSANFNFLLLIPIATLTYLVAPQIVQIVFERGKFDSVDTMNTAIALSFYALGIPFYGFYKILGPTFFTLNKPQEPLYGTMIAVIINVLFSWQMIPHIGFKALALGTSLGSLGSVIFQTMRLSKLLNVSLGFFLGLDLLKVIFSTVLMGLMTIYLQNFWFAEKLNGYDLYWKTIAQMTIGVSLFITLILLLNPKKNFLKKVK